MNNGDTCEYLSRIPGICADLLQSGENECHVFKIAGTDTVFVESLEF